MAPTGPSSTNDAGGTQLNLRDLKTADYLKAESKLTAEQKSALAAGLAGALNANSADAADFADAEAILRLLIWNAEPHVVEAIGKAAAGNPNTPKSLAWALANDDEAAALPVLQSCAVLSDDDLVAIVEESRNFSKMGAIARRPEVSEQISRSLVQHGDESTMHSLLANAKAVIPDDTFGHMLDRFGGHERIQESVANRETLSPSIAQRLAGSTNANVAAKLAERHHIPPRIVQMPGYLDEESDEELDRQITKSIAQKSLDESALTRYLCVGNFDFFCRALAALTKSAKDEVRARMLEAPSDYLPQYWDKTKLPREWLPVVSAAVTALIHIDQNYSKAERQLFGKNIVDRTMANLKGEKIVLSDSQKRFFARQAKR